MRKRFEKYETWFTHFLMNALSIFRADAPVSPYVSAAFLMIVPLLYAFAIKRRCKKPR